MGFSRIGKHEVAAQESIGYPWVVVATELDTLLDRADVLVQRFEQRLPTDIAIFDAHVHVGRDVDGMLGDYGELVALLERYGDARAFAFCLDEEDRAPSFRAANDRTLAYAERSEGRIVPFARLDLADRALVEAERCLDRGARGIKLHSRAQPFDTDDETLDSVFALATERRVPVLVHGGAGMPPVAHGLARLLDRHPSGQLIVAHAGVGDLVALVRHLAGRPGTFFDTAVWSPLDLLDLLARVPPEQIVYASDYPYGQQPSSLAIAACALRAAGADETAMRAVLGGNATGIADTSPPPTPTVPLGPATVTTTVTHARVHQCISMAAPLLWRQRRDTIGVLDLAIAAAADGDHEELCDLMVAARDLWCAVPEIESAGARRQAARAVFQLVQLADVLATTT
jgi:predicted TIM-barrel fold metal-dependent hydrolase